MNGDTQDETAAAVDRARPACPLCGTPMTANPLRYALHGTQGYRAKCPVCGVQIVMSWAPLARAMRRLAR